MNGELEAVRLRLAAGSPPGDLSALPGRARRFLEVASAAGAPLLDALDAACTVEDDRRRTQRAIAVAAAQGRAVTTGLTLAPLVLVPFLGRLFDLDLLAYHRTPLGMVTGTLALTLLAAGAVGARTVVARVGRPPTSGRPVLRRATAVVAAVLLALLVHPVIAVLVGATAWWRAGRSPEVVDPSLADAAELAAVGVAGGASPAAALREAADVLPTLGSSLRRLAFDLEHGHGHGPASGGSSAATGWSGGLDRLADVLTTAEAVGAPVGPTLRRFAAEVRADELARVLAAAERLPVQLTFPTALGSLPGVLLLIGAPIVHDALTAATR